MSKLFALLMQSIILLAMFNCYHWEQFIMYAAQDATKTRQEKHQNLDSKKLIRQNHVTKCHLAFAVRLSTLFELENECSAQIILNYLTNTTILFIG